MPWISSESALAGSTALVPETSIVAPPASAIDCPAPTATWPPWASAIAPAAKVTVPPVEISMRLSPSVSASVL